MGVFARWLWPEVPTIYVFMFMWRWTRSLLQWTSCRFSFGLGPEGATVDVHFSGTTVAMGTLVFVLTVFGDLFLRNDLSCSMFNSGSRRVGNLRGGGCCCFVETDDHHIAQPRKSTLSTAISTEGLIFTAVTWPRSV